MPRKALKSSLEELKNEVDSLVAEKDATGLEEVSSKLDTILADIDESEVSSIQEGLSSVNENLSELEVSHPKITSTLGQVMNLLSSLGI